MGMAAFDQALCQQTLERACHVQFGAGPERLEPVGGGYYGSVYFVTCGGKTIVFKLYLLSGLAQKEAAQLSLLRAKLPLPVPEVYGVFAEDGFYDTLIMEKLEGLNGGDLKLAFRRKGERMKLADNLIDALITLHEAPVEGFGEIGGEAFSDWETCYRARLDGILAELKNRGRSVPAEIQEQIAAAYQNLGRVLCEPVERPSLIHGDLNLWNVMVDPDTMRITGVIDPFDCCRADRELELFQLENATGKRFSLLPKYKERVVLSRFFEIKKDYYHFWDDIKHMALAGLYQEKALLKLGRKLLREMKTLPPGKDGLS